jgi:hypothetical protein
MGNFDSMLLGSLLVLKLKNPSRLSLALNLRALFYIEIEELLFASKGIERIGIELLL